MLTLLPWKNVRSNGGPAPLTFHPLDLFHRFDDVFDRVFDATPGDAANHANVRWNETEKEFVLSFDAPGFEASEFDIQAVEDGLTVAAEHVVKDGEQTRT